MRISDWSSDVGSSDLPDSLQALRADVEQQVDGRHVWLECAVELGVGGVLVVVIDDLDAVGFERAGGFDVVPGAGGGKIDIAAQCLADADQQVCLGPPGLDLRAADESDVDADALSEPGDEGDVQVAHPGAAAPPNSEQPPRMGRNAKPEAQ